MPEKFTLRLESAWMLHDTCRHMVFVREDGEPLTFKPGQFVQIHFEHEGRRLRRSYSVATVPRGPGDAVAVNEIEIAVSYVEGGAATALLSGMRTGDRVEGSGPVGRFCLGPEGETERYLLIATGTGVTPYRAMLPEIERRIAEHGTRFCLVFGAQGPDQQLYADDFEAFQAAHPGFEYYPCFSRRQREAPRPHELAGRVHDRLRRLEPDPRRDIAYLCGNPDMIDTAVEGFKEHGFETKYVRREKYISPK